MAIKNLRELEDGATLVRDEDDGKTFVLKPGVFRPGMTRAEVEAAVAEAADEWSKERGPDSPSGRAAEEGGPFPTEHGGEER